MGSMNTPLPSNYNPTGINPGLNPNFMAENLNDIRNLVPGGSQQNINPLGNTGTNPFLVPASTTAPAWTPPPAGGPPVYRDTNINNFMGIVPNTGVPNYNFGYSTTNPASNQGFQVPNAGNTIGSQIPGFAVSKDLQKSLDKTYGKGFGQTLGKLLSSGMGYNPQVVSAFMTDIQPFFQENMNQILESFASGGVRFSSNAALAAGKFGADFTSHQQALMAQMYQTAFQSYIDVLTKFGSKNTGSNMFGDIANILGLIKSGASGLSAAGVGGTGILGKILGGLASI